MPSISELLANSQLTDDIKIPLPGAGEVTVGELRAYRKQLVDESAAAATESRRRTDEAVAEMARAKSLADDALKVIKLGEQQPPPEDKGGIDWETDQVYSPVAKKFDPRFKELSDGIAALTAQNRQFQQALSSGYQFIVDDYYDRRWSSLEDRPKDKTYKDFLKMAEDSKIVDRYGLPDPVGAYLKSTEQDRLTSAIEKARKEGEAKGRREAGAAAMPRPGGQPLTSPSNTKPGGKSNGASKDLSTSLREAMEQASRDPDILKLAVGE